MIPWQFPCPPEIAARIEAALDAPPPYHRADHVSEDEVYKFKYEDSRKKWI